MIILKGFKTCTIIDNREVTPTLEEKQTVIERFLSKIVDGDFICRIEFYYKNELKEYVSNNTEGGLTSVDSLKHLNYGV